MKATRKISADLRVFPGFARDSAAGAVPAWPPPLRFPRCLLPLQALQARRAELELRVHRGVHVVMLHEHIGALGEHNIFHVNIYIYIYPGVRGP